MLRAALLLIATLLQEAVAAAAPAPFRATGNEPGWSVEIADGRIVLVTDYGAERREAALPTAETEGDVTVYRVTAIGATVRVSGGPCRDDATGMPHPRTVTVEMSGGRLLAGCGGDPADLLVGDEWVVEDIASGGIVDGSRVTLTFDRDGRVFGAGGCNRFNAGYTLTGEGLSFEPAASTMMACEPALMMQERRFFDALETVTAFDVDATDALLLLTADGAPAIRARRS